MIEYAVGVGRDGCGHCLTTLENWHKHPTIYEHENRLIKTFRAASWEEAKEVYAEIIRRYNKTRR